MEITKEILKIKHTTRNSDLPAINFNGYKVFSGNLSQINLEEKTIINTINQNAYTVAERDSPLFKESLKSSDILLPDGIGVVIGIRLLHGIKIKKIAGYNLHNYLLHQLNKIGGSCFYLGSSDENLQKITNRLKNEFPNIRLGTYSPPYKPAFSDEDNETMISIVNEFKPDVLFIGMTAPKQENWVHEQKDKLDANLICSIGAAFDFFAGSIKRPSKPWRRLGLEWFVRLVKEPKRMKRRYLYYGPIFIYTLFKLKYKMVLGKDKKALKPYIFN